MWGKMRYVLAFTDIFYFLDDMVVFTSYTFTNSEIIFIEHTPLQVIIFLIGFVFVTVKLYGFGYIKT